MYERNEGVETTNKAKKREKGLLFLFKSNRKEAILLTVITSFYDKQRHKQIDFERKVLCDLTYSDIEETVQSYFAPFLQTAVGYQTLLREICIDYAVEAYLLGASLGRFGYFGETTDQVHKRSAGDEKALLDDFFDYWCYWTYADAFMLESMYERSRVYITDWWQRGFENAEKRHRLRLR